MGNIDGGQPLVFLCKMDTRAGHADYLGCRVSAAFYLLAQGKKSVGKK